MARTRTLEQDKIVQEALTLIEEQGLEALTMRALGRRLSVEGMTLYTYFPNKAALLDAVANEVVSALDVTWDRSLPWQERVRRGVSAFAALQAEHPRAFPLVYRRTHPSENVTRLTEELFDALRTAGFQPREAALAYQSAVTLIDAALLNRSSWTDDDLRASWKRVGRTVDPKRYPRVKEMAPRAATLTWQEILDSGVDLLLRGLEQRLR